MPQHPPNPPGPNWYAPNQYGLPVHSDGTMQHTMPGPNTYHSTTNFAPGSAQEFEISASVRHSVSGIPGPSNPGGLQDAASSSATAPRRSRYGTLDWESHKSLLQSLYLTENKTLNETMRIMKDEHSFNASAKLYKDKFKEWQWQKYLPAKQADFMVRKAEKRKREEGKKTVFSYGGTVWTSQQAERSLSRSKKARYTEDPMDVDTPSVGISYKTPKAIGPSPSEALVVSPAPNLAAPSPRIVQNEGYEPRDLDSDHEEMDSSDGVEIRSLVEVSDVESGDSEDEPDASIEALPLRWKGFSRGELLSMWKAAQGYIKSGEFQTAERLLLQVLKGYRFLLGPVHEEANEVVYALANLYAQNDRMPEADETIEGLSRELVKKLGYGHERTQQHVLQAVELLNSWHREEDAMGLLAHSKELVEQGRAVNQTRVLRSGRRATTNSGQGKGKGKGPIHPADESDDDELSIEDIIHMIMHDDSSDNLGFGLTIARSHITAKNEAVEGLLLKIIKLCEISLKGDRHIQHLTARAELLQLYHTCGIIDDNTDAYTKSEDAFNTIWASYDWDREKFSSLEIMEAGMQLALEMFKAAFEFEAEVMFNRVSETATMIFHADDERTIWILISIGLAYQTYGTWSQAERWFEHALANALSVWDDDDGIVKSLQKGVDEKHFSYLSDEGRPFKTIFGVSGISIRPGRLHMC